MAPAPERSALRLRVEGTVQGVGFRPFVHRLALRHELAGWVRNDAAGVEILVAGDTSHVAAFSHALRAEAPAPAVVERVEARPDDAAAVPAGFAILGSEAAGEASAPVSPDLATCPDCLAELFDPCHRRHRYPFINCTRCGPRFSILLRIPYDRPNTTMAGFAMCPACAAEYHDPADRRFHAQPNACAVCGPRLAWWDREGRMLADGEAALAAAAAAVRAGRMVAVKGLGGFHLVADARSEDAVRELRRRKRREEKPLALMFPTLESIRAACAVTPLEEALLRGAASPIVLLRRRAGDASVAASVAPGNPCLGAMLPYTPLHHLLLRDLGFPLVATSGNLTDEPICTDEREAVTRLGGIADFLLVHDRPVARPVDDSVVRVAAGREIILRRARGYAPAPVALAGARPGILAVGAHLKSAVAVTIAGRVVPGPHVGDLDTAETREAFEASARTLTGLYGLEPRVVAHDLHPDYHSTRFALGLAAERIAVQHHHAHLAAVMAEHGLTACCLGATWDGTGLGTDGTIWGGEFLVGDRASFARFAHLRAFRLPGGDRAMREPRRSALGVLHALFGDRALAEAPLAVREAFTAAEARAMLSMLDAGAAAPLTSSAGRLFDAVASLCGLRQRCGFEGQAAMDVENAAAEGGAPAPYALEWVPPAAPGAAAVLDWAPMVRQILADLRAGRPVAEIAAAFHLGLAAAVAEAGRRSGQRVAVLGGGCFANRVLLEATVDGLRAAGLDVYWPHRVPPGDGGLALGQAAVALARADGN